MLQLSRWDDGTTLLGIGPAVMVRPWKLVKVTTVMLDLTGTEAGTETGNETGTETGTEQNNCAS